MINRTMPLWYAQPRGTAIASLAVLDAGDDDDAQEGFLPQLAGRLVNIVNGGPAAVVGFLVILAMLSGAPFAGLLTSDILAAVLCFVPLAWCVTAAVAGFLVGTEHAEAPPWASALVSFLEIVGKVCVTTSAVVTVLVVVAMALAVLLGIASAGRERW